MANVCRYIMLFGNSDTEKSGGLEAILGTYDMNLDI